jgi:hypothetical protein
MNIILCYIKKKTDTVFDNLKIGLSNDYNMF